jgi:Zn-dependent M32 family carboxypeptidase
VGFKENLRVYIYLVIAWLALVVVGYLAHKYLQGELITYLVDTIAGIPIIVLIVVFVFGLMMERRSQQSRKQQLMFIKSLSFRLELRNLYIANFLALKSPALTFGQVQRATLAELKKMRQEAEAVEYLSLEAMEPVINQYVEAEPVWREFMNIARDNGFNDIFQDMLYILHFVSDVRTFKELHPGEPFVHEAEKHAFVMQKVMKVLGDGIRRYLEYVIELKEKQPDLFDQVVSDYELLAQARA